MLPAMPPLPRRFRSFSLRTLMVLVGCCAFVAWGWSSYRNRPETLYRAAMVALAAENPDSRLSFYRHENDIYVLVQDARCLSPSAAHAVARAGSIRRLSLKAGSDDGLLREISLSAEALDVLRNAFQVKTQFMFEVTCSRPDLAKSPSPGGHFLDWQ